MVTRPPAARTLTPYATTMLVGDGDAAFDTSAEVAAIIQANTANASYTKIWERTIPAQQIVGWGSGPINAQRNQGFMHFFALDVGTGFEEGILRLVVSNSSEMRSRVVLEVNSQRLHTTTFTTAITATPTDINDMVPLPLLVAMPKGGQDDLLQLWFRTTIQTTTVDSCEFSIPATIWQ